MAERDTLWLAGSDYNRARVIEAMADIILAQGGKVKFRNEGMKIRERGYSELISRKTERLERYEEDAKAHMDEDAYRRAAEKCREEIAELEKKHAEAPVIESRFMSKHGLCHGCIRFVLDGCLYYFEFADNPFFPDLYQKIKLDENEEYIGKYYLEELVPDGTPKEYFYDALWSPVAEQEVIQEVAEMIVQMLKEKRPSERWLGEKERRQVPNTYDGSWHWETVFVTDKTKHKVDF